MKFQKIIIIVFLYFFNAHLLLAVDAQEVFKEANQAYQQGNYTAAIEKYESILKAQVFSKDLFYNLGNSYYRTNQLGKAILNYEKAARLAPTDSDIKHNLLLAQSHILDNIEPLPEIFILRWLKILRGGLSPNIWSFLNIFLIWLGIAGFVVWLLNKERLWKKRGFIAGIVCIPLSIFTFLIAQKTAADSVADKFSIIIVKETPLKSSPAAAAAQSLLLHEGIKVEVLEKISNQTKIRLPNSEEGWVDNSVLEKI